MGFYPIVLDLTGRPCLVVGGGPQAERKVDALLEAQARVTVVSPFVTAGLQRHAQARRIRLVARRYRRHDLAGQALVFVATDDPAVNAAVAHHARGRGVWVNAADDPAHCDFTLPSILRRSELTVAVSTGGASPALARAIREELESYFTDDYGVLARISAEARRELRAAGIIAGPDAWRRALDVESSPGIPTGAPAVSGRPEPQMGGLGGPLGALHGEMRRLIACGESDAAKHRLVERLREATCA